MSQFNHNQSAGANSPAPVSTRPASPPPLGYPTNDVSHCSVAPAKVRTKSKGAAGCICRCLRELLCCLLDEVDPALNPVAEESSGTV